MGMIEMGAKILSINFAAEFLAALIILALNPSATKVLTINLLSAALQTVS